MRILIVSVGRRSPAWLKDALAEYTARFPREFRIEDVEIQPARRGKDEPVQKIKAAEAAKIRAAIPQGSIVIALDEGGKQLKTRNLAERLRGWRDQDQDAAFVIGGAEGIDGSLIREARECWSLSPLTLPHGLARLLLVEQLYRAWSILNNHPYHRE